MLRLLLSLALLAGLLVSAPREAAAQTRAILLWLAETGPDAGIDTPTLERLLADVLSTDTSARHLVGLTGLRDATQGGQLIVPDCLMGVTRCASPAHAIIGAARVDNVVRLTVHEQGRRVTAEVLDTELRPVVALDVRGSNLRETVYRAVGELTTSTAQVSVQSEPPADVWVDGERVGRTPWRGAVKVGARRIEVREDGWFTRVEDQEFRPGESQEFRIRLDRRYATILVRSGTPNAQLFLVGDDTPQPVNEPIVLDPGTHVLELRAADHDTSRREISLIAGEDREMRINLMLSPATIERRERQRILDRPLLLQASLGWASSRQQWRGAETDGGDVRCVIDPATSDCGGPDRSADALSLDVDALFTWRWLELRPVGLSFGALFPEDGTRLSVSTTGGELRPETGTRTELRFLGFGARHLVNSFVEPYLRTGPALQWDILPARRTDIERDDGLSRTSFLWQLGAGVRLHLNRVVYVNADLGASFDLSHGDTGTRFGGAVGVGLNLPDALGLTGLFDGWFPSESAPTPSAPAPSEL